jgi:phosphoribosylformimino-5-aminoimidazole carboxamide ribotide isomerase
LQPSNGTISPGFSFTQRKAVKQDFKYYQILSKGDNKLIIYPAIDISMGKAVRLEQGDFNRAQIVGSDPLQIAREWQAQGAQALHVVDLDGARAGFPCNLSLIKKIAQEVSIPIQVGGGFRTEQEVSIALAGGISKIIIGTKAVNQIEWVSQLAKHFSGRIAVALDAREGKISLRGWQDETEVSVFDMAKRIKDSGIPEIIYTDIGRDGMQNGVDLDGIRSLLAGGVQVIASGGVSGLDDIRMLKSLEKDGVTGVLIGKALYSGRIRLQDALALANCGDAGEEAC